MDDGKRILAKSNVKTSGIGGGDIVGILNISSGGSSASSSTNIPMDDGNPRSMIRPFEKKVRRELQASLDMFLEVFKNDEESLIIEVP